MLNKTPNWYILLLSLLYTSSAKTLYLVFSSLLFSSNEAKRCLSVAEPLPKIAQRVSLKSEAIRYTKAGESDHWELKQQHFSVQFCVCTLIYFYLVSSTIFSFFLISEASNNRVLSRTLDEALLRKALLLEPSNPTSSFYFCYYCYIYYIFVLSTISLRNRQFFLQNSILLVLSPDHHQLSFFLRFSKSILHILR